MPDHTEEFLDYCKKDVEFEEILHQQWLDRNFQLKLRWDDYLGFLLTFVIPALYFVFVGTWWFLPLALIFGYFWAINAGTTDFENSVEFGYTQR